MAEDSPSLIRRLGTAWRRLPWKSPAFWFGLLALPTGNRDRVLWLVERGGDLDFIASRIAPFLWAHWHQIIPLLGLCLIAHALYRNSRRPIERANSALIEIEEPEAPRENVEQLRLAYSYGGKDAKLACDFLENEICRAAFAIGGDKDLIGRLMRDLIVDASRLKQEGLKRHIETLAPGISESQFRELLLEFHDVVIGDYAFLAVWILNGGMSILRQDYLGLPTYAVLYDHHEKTVEKLREIGSRIGMHEMISDLVLVENCLVRPSRLGH